MLALDCRKNFNSSWTRYLIFKYMHRLAYIFRFILHIWSR